MNLPTTKSRQAHRPPSAHFSTCLCTHVSPCVYVSVAAHTFVPTYVCLSVPVCLPRSTHLSRVCLLSAHERMLSHPGLWLSYVLVIAPTGHALTLVCLAHAPHEPPGCSRTPTACESLLSPSSTPSMRASDPMGTARSLERVGELSPSPHPGAEAASCGSEAIWGTWRSGLGAGYSASCPGHQTHPSPATPVCSDAGARLMLWGASQAGSCPWPRTHRNPDTFTDHITITGALITQTDTQQTYDTRYTPDTEQTCDTYDM